MLTRADKTVADCVSVIDQVLPLGVMHIGFKDIGVDRATLITANDAIKGAGATSYMEVVSTGAADSLDSARIARDIGVDCLLGGTEVAATHDILDGSGIGYYPFAGRPRGHPTVLDGTAADIAAQCRSFEAAGCAGVDLLAYRATEDDPIALIRAARGAIDGVVIVAGSVDSPQRIQAVAAADADAFTIGTAVFDATFAPQSDTLADQVRAIIDACAATEPVN